ncbi:DUF5133 domain-containing protein [Streptomyces sp. NPDC021562]|uniref:DUF5133 domain-containing protein n=1 Tax=Streptomyces sp. NPDC021562 TaxID=3155121 RepID=UPI0033EE1706
MLMPHPATLRRLVKEYEALLVTETLVDDASVGTRLQDLAYTLCVSTGTREVTDALRVAHDYLDRTMDSADTADAAPAAGPARTIVSRQVSRTPARSVLSQG